jgi:phosphoribosylanthranilate isomerase
MPDYAGFVFHEKSRRNISPAMAREFRRAIHPTIITVGVFVNASGKRIADLYREGVISMIQLHGNEDDDVIKTLRDLLPDAAIWKAFQIRSEKDLEAASVSTADMVLLDNGNGTGACFDWSLLQSFPRPFILAGGLTPQNIPEAITRFHPYAVDLSSGVETDGFKDKNKMMAAVAAAKRR